MQRSIRVNTHLRYSRHVFQSYIKKAPEQKNRLHNIQPRIFDRCTIITMSHVCDIIVCRINYSYSDVTHAASVEPPLLTFSCRHIRTRDRRNDRQLRRMPTAAPYANDQPPSGVRPTNAKPPIVLELTYVVGASTKQNQLVQAYSDESIYTLLLFVIVF